MPDIPNVRFERNRKGGIETWYAPEGATRRDQKTYLGYIGKRTLDQIGSGTRRDETIRHIVDLQMRKKGIA